MRRTIFDLAADPSREGKPIVSEYITNPASRIRDAQDARRLARKRLPRLIFDFIEGAAGRETSATRNTSRFDDILLQSRVMADVRDRSLKTQVLGRSYDLPFGIAPMGMCNLACPDADACLGALGKRRNLPVCLSFAASSTMEEMRGWAGENAWFQLYVGQSVEQSLALVDRARSAGYDVLVLTVDVPQVARRTRDLRNGFTVPFRIGPRQFLDFALHPRWSLATLKNGAPSPRNFDTNAGSAFNRHASRAGADWAFLDRLRAHWEGHLIVKGVTSATDALRIRAAGADAVYVSNHGGRQLDSAPAAIDLLPPIRRAVGPNFPLIFDSGLRSGEDVIKALALGADFVMLGRPILQALAAEGADGLAALVDAIAGDISVAMAQLGVTEIHQLDEQCLWQGAPAHPAQDIPTLKITTKRA